MFEIKRAAERATQTLPIVLADTESITPSLADLQASRISRLYALSYRTAITVATLAYGVVR